MQHRPLEALFARLSAPGARGLLGVALIFLAAGSLNLWSMPLLEPNDESRHMGYAMALAEGRIPHVLETIDLTKTKLGYLRGTNIQAAAAHPPLYHGLVALPLKAAADADKIAWGILFARALSLFFGLASIFYAHRLVRLLLPQRPDLALAAVAIVSCFPVYVASSSIAYGDSLGALAFIATLSSSAEIATRGMSSRRYALACFWFAMATLTRLPVMVAASPALLLLGVPRFISTPGSIAPRLGRAVLPVLGAGLVGLLAGGWFYALNISRYGDPSATSALLTRLERQPIPIIEIVLSRDWQRLFEYQWAAIVGMVRKNTLATHFSRTLIYLAILGGIVHLVRFVRRRRDARSLDRAALDRAALDHTAQAKAGEPGANEVRIARWVVAASVLAYVVLLFVFRARGGLMTARYAMPFAWAIGLGLAALLSWPRRPSQLQAVLAALVGFLFLTIEQYQPDAYLVFGELRLSLALEKQGIKYADTFVFVHVAALVLGGLFVTKSVGATYRGAGDP